METGRVDGKVAGCDECNAWANLDTSRYLVVEFPAWGLTDEANKGDSGGLTYLIVSVPPVRVYVRALPAGLHAQEAALVVQQAEEGVQLHDPEQQLRHGELPEELRLPVRPLRRPAVTLLL